jgi:hypothetical protein
MKWYNYVACFFEGMFLANVVPHFIHGVSGDAFPTPFANPPGKGLSSPEVNVLWALLNLVIGYILFRAGKISNANKWTIVIFFAGILFISLMLSSAFVDKVHQ